MIIIHNSSGIFKYKTVYNAARPSLKYGLLSEFKRTGSNHSYFGFIREESNTLINNLKIPADTLLTTFHKNTAYEIRRSVKDNMIVVNSASDITDFIDLYDRFAVSRGWRPYRLNVRMINNLHVTTCSYNGEIIISHLYFFDKDSKRVCLSSSVSCIDEINDKSKLAMLGRANRHLHFYDMLYFKDIGFDEYDFGGYDTIHTDDNKKQGINSFKEGFNGTLVYESNYTSYFLYFLLKVKKGLKKTRKALPNLK